MSRTVSRWAAVTAAVFAFTTLGLAPDADAQRRKRRKRKAPTQKINAKALAELMGAFKFGMSREQVTGVVAKQIRERYAEKISATSDIAVQDGLRKEQKKKIKQFKRSFTEFKGKKGGWDVSIVDDQFAHKAGESMMVLWETHEGRNQRRFFFFHEGRLYKFLLQIDASVLKEKQRNFGAFKSLMIQRYGPAIEHARGLTWKARGLRVDALDKLRFYHALCLIVTDTRIEADVLAAREAVATGPKQRDAVIKSITAEDGDEGPDLDDGADTIDSILED